MTGSTGNNEMELEKRNALDGLKDFGTSLSDWTSRNIPDAWIIALLLTVIVFILAITWGGVTVPKALGAWGGGFWALLTLMAQFTFCIVVAYACASAPVVAKWLNAISSLPNPDKPWQAVLMLAIFSIITAWINWAVTLVLCAMLIPYLAKNNPKTDYRLMAAIAFMGGACLWGAGLSSTAPLIIATPDNFLIASGVINELVTVERTIFSSFNVTLLIIQALVMLAVVLAVCPKPGKAFTISEEQAESMIVNTETERPTSMTLAEKALWWPGWNLLFAVMCLYYMISKFIAVGSAAWTIDMYNLTFLTLALVLSWRPTVFLNACQKGITGAWGIIVQFPFYGGIFGLIQSTGLGAALTGLLVSISSKETFLPIVYWYSGILNYFIPSGGSKFAIEAPFIIKAGQTLGISPASTTLAYAWGDMLTNVIQPFFAIPVLSITRTKFGDIFGYCFLLFIVYAIVGTIAIFLLPIGL